MQSVFKTIVIVLHLSSCYVMSDDLVTRPAACSGHCCCHRLCPARSEVVVVVVVAIVVVVVVGSLLPLRSLLNRPAELRPVTSLAGHSLYSEQIQMMLKIGI